MTYDGWKVDVMVAESRWASGHDITSKLEFMRRKQRLHEGERSDVMLEVLDGVKQGLTYDGWKLDVYFAESRWAHGHDITSKLKIMRRKQRLHDSRQESISESLKLDLLYLRLGCLERYAQVRWLAT